MEESSVRREGKRVYKLPPCPSYDVEGMESWLTDLSEQGLILSKDGFFLGVAAFEKGAPRPLKYRLDASPKPTGMWSENNGAPKEEAVEISESCGWEYVAARGQFFIYRSEMEQPRELNTDPQVQALAIGGVRKRERAAIVTSFLWLFLYPIGLTRGNLLLMMMNAGTVFILWGLLWMLWLFASTVARAVHLGKLRRRLLRLGTLNHNKDWKKKAALYQGGNFLLILLIVFWIGFFLSRWSYDVMKTGKVPLSEYQGKPPFATMRDFAPQGDYTMDEISFSNTVEEKADWLAPVIVKWRENATVRLPNEKSLTGGLLIDYYETTNTWLAKEAAREYLRSDQRSNDFQELPLPDLGVDYAAAYLDSVHFETLLLQHGNKVMRVQFYQTSSTYSLSLSEWAQIAADSLK